MKNEERYKIFKSRIGLFIWGFVWLIVASVFFFMFRAVYFNPTPVGIVILVVLLIPTSTFLIYIMTGIQYLIDDNNLIIKVGRFTEREIPIKNIQSLERTYNPLSSPANSLKRIKIRYRYGQIMISPGNEKSFIRFLMLKNSQIKLIKLNT
jgi:hypothetical protein